MPIELKDNVYYRTSEVCEIVGISRATLLRWMKAGVITDVKRDRRGWRLFGKNNLTAIQKEANRIID